MHAISLYDFIREERYDMIPSTLSAFSTPFPPSTPSFRHRNPSPNLSSTPPTRPRARRSRCACKRGGRSWDSNAESFRAGRFGLRDDAGGGFWKRGRRRWWSDESSSDEAEFDGDVDDDDDDIESPWERIWIFKVFKAYGYLLPAIIASMLLATGPKAFLMALAVPLGQSALSLAFEKVWGNSSEGRRAGPKTKKQPFSRSTKWRDEDSSKVGETAAQGYQSWVSGDVNMGDEGDDVVYRPPRSFGGWDELDRQQGSTKRTSRSQRPEDSGKLSSKGRYRDAPLFLRLLIAVFPFLGSWTRML